MKVVEPLLIAVKSHQPDESEATSWIRYLPPHLHVNDLAQKLAKRSKVDPCNGDLGGCPCINYASHSPTLHNDSNASNEDDEDSHPLMPSPSMATCRVTPSLWLSRPIAPMASQAVACRTQSTLRSPILHST
jgi:hypothetical protein